MTRSARDRRLVRLASLLLGPLTAIGCERPAPAAEQTGSASQQGHPEQQAQGRTAGAPLVVRVLDVGQGDAILIENGGSRVLVDGGPDARMLGQQLTRLGVKRGDTIDVVVLSHAHADHYRGLQELFASRRRLVLRFFFENGDPSPNRGLDRLRDSVGARVRGAGLVYRDTDDPCANGRTTCTLTLRGGAKLHVMRPLPAERTRDANDRSVALKLVSADSGFTMWLAGDAEHEAIRWFATDARYGREPGMRVDVLKANHHGSCDGIDRRYLDALRPSAVVASLAADNEYGHMHAQTTGLLAARRIPWWRTDRNGMVTITAPGRDGARYAVDVERGGASERGLADRPSRQEGCRGLGR